MLTLDEVVAQQADLNQICADRPLETSEIFTPNAFYGHDAILKQYAGLPPENSLKVVVPHGVYLNDNFLWAAERTVALPIVLCYPAYRQAIYEEFTDKEVKLSASPFLYLLELLREQPRPAEKKGTIFFPAHSTHHVTVQMNFETLAEEVSGLADEYQPVTVCVYWKDYQLGHHLPFTRRGMRVVSAGHMYAPCFLFRFYHLCSLHRYAASNVLGSYLFYSLKSGCSFFFFGSTENSVIGERHILERDVIAIPEEREQSLKSLFSIPRPTPTAEQIRIVDYYLGAEYLSSARELRELLLYAEKLDRIRFIRHTRTGSKKLMLPPFYQRGVSLSRWRLKLKTWLSSIKNRFQAASFTW